MKEIIKKKFALYHFSSHRVTVIFAQRCFQCGSIVAFHDADCDGKLQSNQEEVAGISSLRAGKRCGIIWMKIPERGMKQPSVNIRTRRALSPVIPGRCYDGYDGLVSLVDWCTGIAGRFQSFVNPCRHRHWYEIFQFDHIIDASSKPKEA